MARAANRLPKKVRDQEKRAAALMGAEGETPSPVAIVPDAPALEAPVQELSAEAPPAPEGAPVASDVAPASGEPTEENPVWEQRYSALKGKYDSEIPRMRGTIDGLQQRLADLEHAPAPADPAPAAPDMADAEDREAYGNDFIDLVERRTRQIVDTEMAKLTPQLQKMSGEVAETRRMTTQERMHAQLDTHIESWKDINTSPEFLLWLDDVDPFTGASRAALLRGAYDSGHGDRVVAIFKGYLSDTAPATPAPVSQIRKPGRANLADLAAPGATRTAGRGPTEALPPTPVTRAEIQAFYSDVARGAYKNRPQDQKDVEARINSAVARGLVT